MSKRITTNIKSTKLCCTKCGFNYIHMFRVKTEDRTDYNGGEYQSVEIYASCENCEQQYPIKVLELQFHEGQVFIGVIIED